MVFQILLRRGLLVCPLAGSAVYVISNLVVYGISVSQLRVVVQIYYIAVIVCGYSYSDCVAIRVR